MEGICVMFFNNLVVLLLFVDRDWIMIGIFVLEDFIGEVLVLKCEMKFWSFVNFDVVNYGIGVKCVSIGFIIKVIW